MTGRKCLSYRSTEKSVWWVVVLATQKPFDGLPGIFLPTEQLGDLRLQIVKQFLLLGRQLKFRQLGYQRRRLAVVLFGNFLAQFRHTVLHLFQGLCQFLPQPTQRLLLLGAQRQSTQLTQGSLSILKLFRFQHRPRLRQTCRDLLLTLFGEVPHRCRPVARAVRQVRRSRGLGSGIGESREALGSGLGLRLGLGGALPTSGEQYGRYKKDNKRLHRRQTIGHYCTKFWTCQAADVS